MKKIVLATFLSLVGLSLLVRGQDCVCTSKCEFAPHERTITVGIAGSIRTPIGGLSVEASIGLSYTLTRSVTVNHECSCDACCPGTMAVTAYTTATHELFIWDPSQPQLPAVELQYEQLLYLVPEGGINRTEPTRFPSGGCTQAQSFTSSCLSESLWLDFAAGFGFRTVSGTISLSSRGGSLGCISACRPEAGGKKCSRPPVITDYPASFYIPEGGVRRFKVAVFDPDGEDDEVILKAESKQATVSPSEVRLKEVDSEGKRWVWITVSDPKRDGEIIMFAKDSCRNTDWTSIPFTVLKRPIIEFLEMNEAPDLCFINREATARLLKFRITDPNPTSHDIEVRVEAIGGRATFGISSETLTTISSGEKVSIRFCPNECATEGMLRLTAWIKGYPDVSSTMELKVPLKPLGISIVPAGEIRAREGREVQVEVSAEAETDREITLKKVSGPGDFGEIKGMGNVKGTYTWEAEGYDPWRLVVFEATDQCEDSSRAYLLIHVVQPPRVGNTEVWVRRGENLEHTLAECL